MPAPSAKDAGNAVVSSTLPYDPNNNEKIYALLNPDSNLRKSQDGLARFWRDPKWPENHPWDPRSQRRSGAGGVKEFSNLYRGYITQMRQEPFPVMEGAPKVRRRVNFQYNPTDISINYSINTDVYPADSVNSEGLAPVLAAQGQTISWTMYFNRTYEMLVGSKRVGVMADIQSLEYMLGSHDGQGLAAVDMMVCFGMTKSGKPIAFNGWISNLDVQLLQFTHRMIPTVAMVQVGMVRRFVSSDTSSASSDASGVVSDVTTKPARAVADIIAGALKGQQPPRSARPDAVGGGGSAPKLT
jgi:hypothetical protein